MGEGLSEVPRGLCLVPWLQNSDSVLGSKRPWRGRTGIFHCLPLHFSGEGSIRLNTQQPGLPGWIFEPPQALVPTSGKWAWQRGEHHVELSPERATTGREGVLGPRSGQKGGSWQSHNGHSVTRAVQLDSFSHHFVCTTSGHPMVSLSLAGQCWSTEVPNR